MRLRKTSILLAIGLSIRIVKDNAMIQMPMTNDAGECTVVTNVHVEDFAPVLQTLTCGTTSLISVSIC